MNTFFLCLAAVITDRLIKVATHRIAWRFKQRRRFPSMEHGSDDMPTIEREVQLLEYIDLTDQPTGLQDEWYNYCDTLQGNGKYAMSCKIEINDKLMIPFTDWLTFLQERDSYAG